MFSPTTTTVTNQQATTTTTLMTTLMMPFGGGGGSPQQMVLTAYDEDDPSGSGNNKQPPPLRRRSKKSRQDYANSVCAVCSAPADGLHYGAISCRSCNAFFRRSVTYQQHFVCRKDGNCAVDVSVRCACRACRLAKCKQAGMRDTDVQPKRDPTGSQKNRRAPQRRRHPLDVPTLDYNGAATIVKTEMPGSVTDCSSCTLLPSVESAMERHYTIMPEDSPPTPRDDRHPQTLLLSCCQPSTAAAAQNASCLCLRNSAELSASAKQHHHMDTTSSSSSRAAVNNDDANAIQFIKSIKREMTTELPEGQEDSGDGGMDQPPQRCHHHASLVMMVAPAATTTSRSSSGGRTTAGSNVSDDGIGTQLRQPPQQLLQAATPMTNPADHHHQQQFDDLVKCYREHLLLMNRMMVPVETQLNDAQPSDCSKWRPTEPSDVTLLSQIELGGLQYWMDKMTPFRHLPASERNALFKRYSVRKLTLAYPNSDHTYTASKYPALIAGRNFAMLNNTYVPPERTGFETARDDERTRKAKYQILRPTIERQWHSLVLPFAALRITDAEIVALQMLLLWSATNNRFVQEESTRQLMRTRREWILQRLFNHYTTNADVEEPPVRFGQVLLLLPELELVCDMHCKDFQVAQLFEFGNLSQCWYEKYAYSSLNIA